MNITEQLPEPLNTFVIDVPAHQYYDFELPADSTYPLKGVTYPVDYGHIVGYTTEDDHELDLFVGSTSDGLIGYVSVFRGEDRPNEHKFLVGITNDEWEEVREQLKPVLISHDIFSDLSDLLNTIKKYKD